MAPKSGNSTSRSKKEDNQIVVFKPLRFYTKQHEDNYYKIICKRIVIPEAKFKLKEDEYPETQEQIQKRGWKILADPEINVGITMIHEFYTNP
ncbi:hypothetical protein AHAS_Ahas16G0172000 [Arachis hypogaea]